MKCHQLVVGYKAEAELQRTVQLCPGLYSPAPELNLHLCLPYNPAVSWF